MSSLPAFKNIADRLLHGFVIVDLDWRLVYINPTAATFAGKASKTLVGKIVWEEFPSLLGTQLEEELRSSKSTQALRRFEYVYPATQTWVEIEIYPSAKDLSILFRDISDHKRAAEQIQNNERQLRDCLDHSAVAIHWVGPDGGVLWANDAELEMLGYDRKDYIGQHISKFHVDTDAIQDILTRLAAKEEIRNYEARLRCKDGSIKDVLISSNVLWEQETFVHTRCFTVDVTARKGWERSAGLLSALIESSEDAIITKNLEGVIQSWNPSAERIFGYSAAEAIGQPVTFLMPSDRVKEEEEILARLKQGKRVEHFETVRRRKDHTNINVSLSISPIRDSSGTIIAASKIARDITAQKQAEASLQASEARFREIAQTNAHLYGQAQQADRLKDEFLATLSHELRTPLNSILGWSAMLRAGYLDTAKVTRALASIERSAKTQLRLVEDLLDVSRIITGRMSLQIVPMDLGAAIRAGVDMIRPTAELKGVRLEAIIDSRAESLSGDPDRIQQVVWNLLSNAVKFTPKGGRIQVRLERVNSHVELSVSDTGEGITPEFMPYVFDRFRQAEASTAKRRGGLGLGLAIVRHLVELHAGTVRAESAGPGAGSTFIVKLPLRIVRTSDALPEGVPVPYPAEETKPLERLASLTGVRVLAVDDDPESRHLLLAILEAHGATVTTAGSVSEGISELKRIKPDILLSDIGMPGEDGYALIKQVRALSDPAIQHIPAIALTAHTRLEDRVRALSAGYDTHIGKPFEPLELVMIASKIMLRARPL